MRSGLGGGTPCVHQQKPGMNALPPSGGCVESGCDALCCRSHGRRFWPPTWKPCGPCGECPGFKVRPTVEVGALSCTVGGGGFSKDPHERSFWRFRPLFLLALLVPKRRTSRRLAEFCQNVPGSAFFGPVFGAVYCCRHGDGRMFPRGTFLLPGRAGQTLSAPVRAAAGCPPPPPRRVPGPLTRDRPPHTPPCPAWTSWRPTSSSAGEAVRFVPIQLVGTCPAPPHPTPPPCVQRLPHRRRTNVTGRWAQGG